MAGDRACVADVTLITIVCHVVIIIYTIVSIIAQGQSVSVTPRQRKKARHAPLMLAG